MHAVREDVLAAQAEAAGLPLCRVPIPAPCPGEAYEEAMRRALQQAKEQRITHMVFGDPFLEDIRAYREKQLAGTGITPVFPLWLRPTAELAREMINSVFQSEMSTELCGPFRGPLPLPARVEGQR